MARVCVSMMPGDDLAIVADFDVGSMELTSAEDTSTPTDQLDANELAGWGLTQPTFPTAPIGGE